MTAATEAKWRERVQGWRASGKSAEAFAAEGGFAGSTLRFWASRLKTGSKVVKAAVPMARVIRRAVASTPLAARDGRGEVAVVVGGARIAVERGFDAVLLREVVLALAGGQ